MSGENKLISPPGAPRTDWTDASDTSSPVFTLFVRILAPSGPTDTREQRERERERDRERGMASLIEAFRALPLASGLNFHNAFSARWWLSYAVTAYADDPYHVLVEATLFFIVIWLMLRPTYDPKKTETLSEQVCQSLFSHSLSRRLSPSSCLCRRISLFTWMLLVDVVGLHHTVSSQLLCV